MKFRFFLLLLFCIFFTSFSNAQVSLGSDLSDIDYNTPKEYEIGGITVTGVQFLDNNMLIMISGLAVGDKITIPGDKISGAIDKLWEQGLFENIKITATKIQGHTIFLDIFLQERPRLSKFKFIGVRKGEADKIREEIKLSSGDVVTENVVTRTKNAIVKYFDKKGYLNATADIKQIPDTAISNSVMLYISIQKNKRVKIADINIHDNQNISDGKIRRAMKETKQKRIFHIFKSSKFIEEDYKADLEKVIEKYNELGYRDAKIVKDSVSRINNKLINVDVWVYEGKKYYFNNISFVGNTKYTSKQLGDILKIRKGDIYNQTTLTKNLSFNPSGYDISSLYMDDGYLFFQAIPVEVQVNNDSIDIEIRIREGKQARINKVTVKGNTKTNDHVIIREIKTIPGQMFSRADIIRTTRELAQLRYFNAETLKPVPTPNPENGTVDIEYQVEETSSDQVELSGGWGGGMVVGTLGLSFNNFSAKNLFNGKAWRPLPAGDGQKLSLRGQTNGQYYYSVSASFTEPWLGGKKPNAFSVSVYHSKQTNGLASDNSGYASLSINGFTLGLGKRVKWPDDFFTIYHAISLQNYTLKNYGSLFSFSDGYANNLNYSLTIARNSIDAPIYARSGSEISLTMQLTPPYSLFQNRDFAHQTDQERYKFLEYHKWKFKASWFFNLTGKWVLNTKAKFGFVGYYNKDVGYPPFERFYLGGDGLSGYSVDGRELVALRGYGNNTLTPLDRRGYPIGGNVFDKYTVELRYPLSLNPNATIYGLTFLEGGNAWAAFKQFNPFNMYKSAGFGIRIFLPMFGMLGLDWGYGFDKVPGLPDAAGGQFHFSINQSID
ncbi:MAG: outer membrane protein assembly factor BamA [Bacteroidetes bacterium]|nr:outer membrane protein assembly factor BamA [Bacteroidota bacterium]